MKFRIIPKRVRNRWRRKFENSISGYRKMAFLFRTYATPFWKALALLVLINLVITIITFAMTILTAATLDALTGQDIVRRQAGAALPSFGRVNLSNIGSLAFEWLGLKSDDNRFMLVMFLATIGLAAALLKNGLSFAANVLGGWIGMRTFRSMQFDLVRHIYGFSISFFFKRRTGELMSRLESDTSLAMADFHKVLNTLIISPILLTFYCVLIIKASWFLFAGIVVAGMAHHGISVLLHKPIRKNVVATQTLGAEVRGVIQEGLANIRVVKSFSTENIELDRLKDRTGKLINEMWRGIIFSNIQDPARQVVNQLVQFIILGFAAYEFTRGHVNLSTCLLFVFTCRQVVAPISELSTAYVSIAKILAASERVFEYFSLRTEVPEGHAAAPAFRETVQLKNVSFQYDKAPILKDMDLTVHAGETIALVGPSGAGKSTLIDLFLRFYDPQQGSILLDGVDIRSFHIESYRRNFGVVSQESLLFNTTIEENILYASKNKSKKELERAARIAHAHHFILDLPNGYQTHVGDRGIRLSGGQRQRIAIARAMAARSPILLLDEATSALDSESEKEVQAAINDAVKESTAIIIAHRLSTILSAHRIAVIDQGRIQAIGPHAELVETCPLYQRLYRLQFGSASTPEPLVPSP